MNILLATGNEGKVVEVLSILSLFCQKNDFSECSLSNCEKPSIVSLKDYLNDPKTVKSIEMPEETGVTYTENSQIKALALSKETGMVTIADDSGLEVSVLDGRPGLYSSRYGATDKDRIDKLLVELDGLVPAQARFVCVATIAFPDGKAYSFEGFVKGEIVKSKAGTSGFGFDPIFLMKDYDCTMAQLSTSEKNRISHRSLAFFGLFDFIANSL